MCEAIRTETGTNACAMRPGVGWKADVAGQEACSTVWYWARIKCRNSKRRQECRRGTHECLRHQ